MSLIFPRQYWDPRGLAASTFVPKSTTFVPKSTTFVPKSTTFVPKSTTWGRARACREMVIHSPSCSPGRSVQGHRPQPFPTVDAWMTFKGPLLAEAGLSQP
jgi:hypothetical protein